MTGPAIARLLSAAEPRWIRSVRLIEIEDDDTCASRRRAQSSGQGGVDDVVHMVGRSWADGPGAFDSAGRMHAPSGRELEAGKRRGGRSASVPDASTAGLRRPVDSRCIWGNQSGYRGRHACIKPCAVNGLQECGTSRCGYAEVKAPSVWALMRSAKEASSCRPPSCSGGLRLPGRDAWRELRCRLPVVRGSPWSGRQQGGWVGQKSLPPAATARVHVTSFDGAGSHRVDHQIARTVLASWFGAAAVSGLPRGR